MTAQSTGMTTGRQSNSTAIAKQQADQTVAFSPPRLPYHPAIEERYGIDKSSWKALTEVIFPLATSVDSIIMALSYLRARKLDPFKKLIHIVPIYDKSRNCMVDTVWPGIGELRTTAFRTGMYAGRGETEFGPEITKKVGNVEVTFPEWARITVMRRCGSDIVPFVGPKVYWLETYSQQGRNDSSPNSMWLKRPRGQHEKCAEAAALRAAFPEELGDTLTDDEIGVANAIPVMGSTVGSKTKVTSSPLNNRIEQVEAEMLPVEAEQHAEPEAVVAPPAPPPKAKSAPKVNPRMAEIAAYIAKAELGDERDEARTMIEAAFDAKALTQLEAESLTTMLAKRFPPE